MPQEPIDDLRIEYSLRMCPVNEGRRTGEKPRASGGAQAGNGPGARSAVVPVLQFNAQVLLFEECDHFLEFVAGG